MKKYFSIFCILLLTACYENYDESKDLEIADNKIIPVEIINSNDKVVVQENIELLDFNDKEKEVLLSNEIEPKKLSELIKKSNNGNEEAIIILYELYDKLNFNEKFEKIKNIALEYNVEGILRDLVVKSLNKEDYKTATRYIKKLSYNNENEKVLLVYNEKMSSIYIEKKEYEKALKFLNNAHKLKSKTASLNIAYINLTNKNIEEAIKWFEIAYKINKKSAGYELAVIYFNNKEYEKALPYLLEQYELGEEKITMQIAISYYKLDKYDEAIKWLELSKESEHKNDVIKLIDEINGKREGSYNVN